MKLLPYLVATFGILNVVIADDALFETRAGQALPNVELVAGLGPPVGEVSLVADYKNADEKGVPLYLINQSKSPASFSSQDGDLYIKLETQDKDGKWVRAQSHAYSFCGNSYGSRVLQPGMHYRLLGYRPKGGQKAVIRFAMHTGQTLVSNVGEGLFTPEDIEKATYDRMSLSGVPRQLSDAFDSTLKPKERSPAQMVVCFELLHAYGRVPALKREAERMANEWRASKIEVPATKSFDSLLDQPWENEVSATRLLHQCLLNIEVKNATAEEQAMRRELSWRVAGELASMEFGSDQSRHQSGESRAILSTDWKSLAKIAVAHLAKAKRDEAIGMSQVLQPTLLTDSTIPSEDLEPLLQGDPYLAAKVAANALARRGRTDRLAELAMKLPAENQLSILVALASGGGRSDAMGLDGWGGVRQPAPQSKEEAFWQLVLTTQTERACDVLRYVSPRELGPDSFHPIVIESLRAHWRNEVARSKSLSADFPLPEPSYSARLSLDFLAKAKRKEDIPLFRDLLAYRGYEEQKSYKSGAKANSELAVFAQLFGVRHASIEALKSMGEAVPDNIVVECDVSDPTHILEKTNGMRARE